MSGRDWREQEETRQAIGCLFYGVVVILFVVFLGWALLVDMPRQQREVGRCEGRGGVWIRDHGCVRPPVPLPDTPTRSTR